MTPSEPTTQLSDAQRYSSVWRWHLYAGIYVIPFLLMLSLTGLIMLLYQPVIVPLLHGELIKVTPENAPYTSWQRQQQSAQNAFPEGTIRQLRPPLANNESSLFTVKTAAGENINVFVNPYSAKLLGSFSKDDSIYALADDIHGTFLLGKFGDAMIELAAGFILVLTLTGLYMWWPRNGQKWHQALLPRLQTSGRNFWKEIHKSIGFWLAIALIFLSITGLSWTGIWGAKIVQTWNSFPAGVFDNVPTSTATHASLNPGVIEEIPWNLEQTPLPLSGSNAGRTGITTDVNLDTVVNHAHSLGMRSFRVNLPLDQTGVYSIVAASMSKDAISPFEDRTLHIDQYSGKQLMDIRFADYSLMAQAMAVGVPLHMGLWGTANLIINVLICLGCIALSISGLVIWWQRRPSEAGLSLNAPKSQPIMQWKVALALWLVIAITVPLVGVSLLVIGLFDVFVYKPLFESRKTVNDLG